MGKKISPAEYIEQNDEFMRIILGELAENSARINLWWTFARNHAREQPDAALQDLADAEVHLNHHVRLELSDSLRVIRSAMNRLDAELPDDDDHSSDPAPTR